MSKSSIAQSVEHLTVNQGVTGSSPVRGVNKNLSTEKKPQSFEAFFVNRGNFYEVLYNFDVLENIF